MTSSKVAFYILQENQPVNFACRLIEKAYKGNLRIYVHAPNQALAHAVDEALWTYRENSFVPHCLAGENIAPPPPVIIGFEGTPPGKPQMLINLCDEIPTFYTGFSRIAEIITNEEDAHVKGRERYKQYRAKGLELTSHKI